jgi:hypothetical protein
MAVAPVDLSGIVTPVLCQSILVSFQLGDVVGVGLVVLAVRVPEVKGQHGADQLPSLGLTVAQRPQPLVMRSDLRRLWTGQLVLNCPKDRRLASLLVCILGIHDA